MEYIEINKPTKEEQKTALQSYDALVSSIKNITTLNPEIEIEETKERIKIPISALKFLAKILEEIGKGNPISIVPIATEVTTQATAEILGCSRPHVVKLLEEGELPYSKVGKHRRVRYEDVMRFKNEMKKKQKQNIQKLMELDEESGIYDT